MSCTLQGGQKLNIYMRLLVSVFVTETHGNNKEKGRGINYQMTLVPKRRNLTNKFEDNFKPLLFWLAILQLLDHEQLELVILGKKTSNVTF